ncbi:MAG: hypothetical protein IKN96_03480 [Oscillibacter sp.]|nr:hypothetical protein [Oscillibacter sp.]
MFSLREFIKKGFLDAVGRLPDYQVVLNAAGWCDKGVLAQDDLAEIQAAIDAHNAAATVPQGADNGGQSAADSPQGAGDNTEDAPSEQDADADNADAPPVPN